MVVGMGEISGSHFRAITPAVNPRFQAQESPQRTEQLQVKAGFGAGTVSPNVAVLSTIRKTFAQAEQLVPSLEELRQAAREARSALEQRQERASEAVDKNSGGPLPHRSFQGQGERDSKVQSYNFSLSSRPASEADAVGNEITSASLEEGGTSQEPAKPGFSLNLLA